MAQVIFEIKDSLIRSVALAHGLIEGEQAATPEECAAFLSLKENERFEPFINTAIAVVVAANPEVLAKEAELAQLKKQLEGQIKPEGQVVEGAEIKL